MRMSRGSERGEDGGGGDDDCGDDGGGGGEESDGESERGRGAGGFPARADRDKRPS